MQDLQSYFAEKSGHAILGTADAAGKVDMAIYSKPFFLGHDGEIALIMANRLSYANIKTNPNAAYMFIEQGTGYHGKRLYLTKVREEKDAALVQKLMDEKGYHFAKGEEAASMTLVHFRVESVIPLVGHTVATGA